MPEIFFLPQNLILLRASNTELAFAGTICIVDRWQTDDESKVSSPPFLLIFIFSNHFLLSNYKPFFFASTLSSQ